MNFKGASLIRNDLGEKQCRKCLLWRHTDDFAFKTVPADKLNYYCRACKKDVDRLNYEKNGEPVRVRSRSPQALVKQREERARLRELIFSKLGDCARCGFSDKRALQIDHVHSDGFLHRKYGSGGTMKYMKEVLSDTLGRFQILCCNCNWIKRSEDLINREMIKLI